MYSFEPLSKNNISGTSSLHASTSVARGNVSEIVAMGTSITIPCEIDESQRASHVILATRECPLV
ncbi:uncharacterized protein CC84DRAFT_1162675, partial [Paraphaeosphaeria sporulosa]